MACDYKRIILQGIGGSQAYGTAHADSDIDRLSVYLAPINDVLGFADHATSAHYTNPDLHLHELQKFLKLVLKGNPTIMELLWLPQHEIVTDTGKILLDNRTKLMGRTALESAYVGYATQQMKRHGTPKPGETPESARKRVKHLRHCYRLLLQAYAFIATGTLTVRLTTSEKERINEFSDLAPSRLESVFETAIEEIRGLDSPVPNMPEAGWAEVFLIETRKKQMLDINM